MFSLAWIIPSVFSSLFCILPNLRLFHVLSAYSHSICGFYFVPSMVLFPLFCASPIFSSILRLMLTALLFIFLLSICAICRPQIDLPLLDLLPSEISSLSLLRAVICLFLVVFSLFVYDVHMFCLHICVCLSLFLVPFLSVLVVPFSFCLTSIHIYIICSSDGDDCVYPLHPFESSSDVLDIAHLFSTLNLKSFHVFCLPLPLSICHPCCQISLSLSPSLFLSQFPSGSGKCLFSVTDFQPCFSVPKDQPMLSLICLHEVLI